MSNTFLYRMPAGIAGDIQRREEATVEPGLFDASYPCLAYGIFVKLVSGKYRPLVSTGNVNLVVGMLARPYPIQEPQGSSAASELNGAGVPNATMAADVLKRGYIAVKVTTGGATAPTSIAKGDQVYVRTTDGSGKATGDIEAGSITGNSAVTGCFFTGVADSNGFCEVAYNI